MVNGEELVLPEPGDQDLEALILGIPGEEGKPGVPGLLGCVCTALAAEGRPVCCCMWYRGARRPPADRCDCECTNPEGHNGEGQGVAWVRVVQLEDIAQPMQPRPSFGGQCNIPPPQFRLTVEVGIYRCVPQGDDPEDGPSCEERTQAAGDGAWDDRIIRQAMWCCDGARGRRMRFVRQEPVGPMGGCGGSATTYFLDYTGKL